MMGYLSTAFPGALLIDEQFQAECSSVLLPTSCTRPVKQNLGVYYQPSGELRNCACSTHITAVMEQWVDFKALSLQLSNGMNVAPVPQTHM